MGFGADGEEFLFRSTLFERDFNIDGLSESHNERGEDDFELDLEMNDLLDEFNPPNANMDIFTEDRDNCSSNQCCCKRVS